MRFIGGGHIRRLRIVDFKRDKIGIPGRVAAIEYDPNRSARLALIFYVDGEKRYILCPDQLHVGDTIMAGPEAISAPATLKSSKTFLTAPWFTTSNSNPAAARSWSALPASALS